MLHIYKPNPIIVPEDSPVQKRFLRTHEIPSGEEKKIDTVTLFYDVFLDPNTNHLIGLGPAFLNLKKDLYPMSVICLGNTLKYELEEIKGITIFQSETLNEIPNSQFEVDFQFKAFTQTVVIDPIFDTKFRSNPSNRLTLTTVQKDNPIEWVHDWLLWHQQAFGVQRLILYDNGSENLDELIAQLSSNSFELEIVLVDWPFPHGVEPYKYCQLGSLNHCRLKFPVPNGYCINLDVDEYLVASENNLLNLLDSRLKYPAPGVIMLNEFLIPNITSDNRSIPVRVSEFTHRNIVPGYQGDHKYLNRFGRSKYIYSFENIGFNGKHSTDSLKCRLFAQRYSIVKKCFHLLKKTLWESTKNMLRFRIPKPRIDAIYATESELCFFHFTGLNTGWKLGPPKPVRYDSKEHVLEPRIAEIASLINDSQAKLSTGENPIRTKFDSSDSA